MWVKYQVIHQRFKRHCNDAVFGVLATQGRPQGDDTGNLRYAPGGLEGIVLNNTTVKMGISTHCSFKPVKVT
jgi:hypothetical protein